MQWTGWHNSPLEHGKNLYLDWFRTVIGNQADDLDFPSIIPGFGPYRTIHLWSKCTNRLCKS